MPLSQNQYEKKSNNKRFMGGKYTSKKYRLVFMLVEIATAFYSTSIAQSCLPLYRRSMWRDCPQWAGLIIYG